MYKLLSVIPFFIFMTCEGQGKSLISETVSIKHVGTEFKYDVTAVQNFEATPFAQKTGDTLIITDYWAVGQGNDFQADVSIANDTITLEYYHSQSPVVDWSATVETITKITGSKFPNQLIVIFKSCVPYARSPNDREREVGVRDARDYLVKVIDVNSL